MTGELCALWKRVSSDQQETRNQDAELGGHVTTRGYSVARTFDLPDLSASKGKARHVAALDQVVEDMAAGLYTVLVVVHSSRLDRRDEDEQVALLLRVRQAGGRIESVTEPGFGQSDTAGRLVTILAQVQNAEYSRALSGAVRRANAAIDAEGGFRGGRVPLGYRVRGSKRGKRLEPDPAGRLAVEGVFERIAEGQTIAQVRAWLGTLGMNRAASSLAEIVRYAPYWTGRYELTDHAGVVRVHRIEPLVTKPVFDAANANLDSRAHSGQRQQRQRLNGDDYSAAVFCGQCANPCYRNYASTGQWRHRVYRCEDCPRNYRADEADAQVEAILSSDVSPEAAYVVVPGSDHGAELERVRDELRDLGARNLPENEEDELRAALRAERKRLESLPVIPPRRELRLTGRTRGQVWGSMGRAERVAYLRRGEFELRLNGRGHDVTVIREWLEDGEPVYVSDGNGGVAAEAA